MWESRSNGTLEITSKQRPQGQEYQKKEMAVNSLRRRVTVNTAESRNTKASHWGKESGLLCFCCTWARLRFSLRPSWRVTEKAFPSPCSLHPNKLRDLPLQCRNNVTTAHRIGELFGDYFKAWKRFPWMVIKWSEIFYLWGKVWALKIGKK